MADNTFPQLSEHAVVFLASGQGSQKPGMGADLLDIPEVAQSFECASEVLGRDIKALVCEGSAEDLNDTRNAQAAIAALSIGIGRALMARGVVPAALCGFSLGQISAMALSGMLSDADAFALIDVRSRLMGRAADEHPGVMSALLRTSLEEAQALCEECAQGEVLAPANLNGGGQMVIAGTPAAVERAEAAWAERGGRFSRLATSGAFHSPLMASAQEEFAAYLDTVQFSEPIIPLIGNVHAAPLTAEGARQELVDHLVNPVRFEESILRLQEAGAEEFVEVGFGGVLANLIKRIDRKATKSCVQDRASFEEAVAERA